MSSVSVTDLLRAIAPRLDNTRSYLRPYVGNTTAKCGHCGLRFVVATRADYWTKRKVDKGRLERGISGTEQHIGDRKVVRIYETYCSEYCAKEHGDTTIKVIRRRQLKAICKHGHPLTPENVYICPRTGIRYCRACKQRRKEEAKTYAGSLPPDVVQARQRASGLAHRSNLHPGHQKATACAS